jgi:hypothetical protein
MIFIRNITDNDICQLISLCEKENKPRAVGDNKDGLGYNYNEYMWITNTLALYEQAKDPSSGCLCIGAFEDSGEMLGFLTANIFSNWYDGSLIADMKDVCTDMTHESYHEVFEKLFKKFISHYANNGVVNWRADSIRAKDDNGLKFGNYIKKVFGEENNIVLNTSVRGVFKDN